MFYVFTHGLLRYIQLFAVAFAGLFDSGRQRFGAFLALLALPIILLLQLIHWLFWLIDEIFYRGYRSVAVDKPVFIIGPPRTGTSFLHHVLARDTGFCTFALWECLFGITVSGRRLCRALMRLDRMTGAPVARLASFVSDKFLSDLDDIHPVSLTAPEEDFFVFMPAALCFLLVVPYPKAKWLFQFSRFDAQYSPDKKLRYLTWYRRCIQKHLYVHGQDKQFLSKNASLAGMSAALLKEFPNARLLTTWRDPLESVPSQLSSLMPALQWFGFERMPDSLRDQLVEQMVFYYEHLATIETQNPRRVARISNTAMRETLAETVTAAFSKIGIDVSEQLAAELIRQSQVSRQHTSAHTYAAEDFGLSNELIRSQFTPGFRFAR